jgi:hypothetical protein
MVVVTTEITAGANSTDLNSLKSIVSSRCFRGLHVAITRNHNVHPNDTSYRKAFI